MEASVYMYTSVHLYHMERYNSLQSTPPELEYAKLAREFATFVQPDESLLGYTLSPGSQWHSYCIEQVRAGSPC